MPTPPSDRDELLAALVAERYNGGGWIRTPLKPGEDNDIICAQRRRLLVAEAESAATDRRAA